MKLIKSLLKSPFVIVLVGLWATLRLYRIEVADGLPFAILIAICTLVIVVEFYKSGDVRLWVFGWDMFWSFIATVLVSVAETFLVLTDYGFKSVDFFIILTVIIDGWFSPFNSHRTALRQMIASFGAETAGDPS